MKTWDDFEKEIYDKDRMEEIKRIARLEAEHGTSFFLDATSEEEMTYEAVKKRIEELKF